MHTVLGPQLPQLTGSLTIQPDPAEVLVCDQADCTKETTPVQPGPAEDAQLRGGADMTPIPPSTPARSPDRQGHFSVQNADLPLRGSPAKASSDDSRPLQFPDLPLPAAVEDNPPAVVPSTDQHALDVPQMTRDPEESIRPPEPVRAAPEKAVQLREALTESSHFTVAELAESKRGLQEPHALQAVSQGSIDAQETLLVDQ